MANFSEEEPKCVSCGSSIHKFKFLFPTFRHVDFTTISSVLEGYICGQCELLQQLDPFVKEQSFYQTREYGNSAQTAHKSSAAQERVRTRSVIQVDHLKKLLPSNAQACLDIGCFDGALLRALGAAMPSVNLLGYDVNPTHNMTDAELGLDITNEEEQIFCGKFDAVIYSHSIMYIDNAMDQLRRIRSHLTDGGFIFIQIPDIQINPLYALMGDQAYIFSEHSLKRVLTCAGYDCERSDLSEFPKELVFVARPTLKAKTQKSVSVNLSDSLFVWEQVQKEIEDLSAEIRSALGSQEVFILGTTIFAAFAHELCPANVLGFVDENLERVKVSFRGLPVHHPASIDSNQRIYVGPDSRGKLKDRMNRIYPSVFF